MAWLLADYALLSIQYTYIYTIMRENDTSSNVYHTQKYFKLKPKKREKLKQQLTHEREWMAETKKHLLVVYMQ